MAYRIAEQLSETREDSGMKVVTDDGEQKELAFRRLESLGYRVGQGLVERYDTFLEERRQVYGEEKRRSQRDSRWVCIHGNIGQESEAELS